MKKNGGAVLKTFSMPRLNAIVLKWAVGILLIWFGIGFLFSGLKCIIYRLVNKTSKIQFSKFSAIYHLSARCL